MKTCKRFVRQSKKRNYASVICQILEKLEARMMLDGDGITTSDTYLLPSDESPTIPPPVIAIQAGQGVPGTSWLTPSAIRSFYGFNNVAFANGTITGNGAGQTISIVDWGNDPDIASDLSSFDTQYSLASTTLNVYAQVGTSNSFSLASSDSSLPPDALTYGTDDEIALDVEWAHALAPSAKIDLVEAYNGNAGNVTFAINYAKTLPGVSTVSMSFGASDGAYADSDFSQTGVTFVASSGDSGSYSPTKSVFNNNSPIAITPSSTGLGGTSDSANIDTLESGISGDFTLVTFIQNGTTATQAGIDIRNDNTAVSANVALLARPGNTSGGSFQYRTTTSGSTTVNNVSSATVGNYLAIQRQGTLYSAFTSTDGYTWTLVGSETIAGMSGNVSVYFAATGPSGTIAGFAGTSYYTPNVADSVSSPATSPNVVSVGGTVVSTNGTGTITGETSAWGNGNASYALGGSGGGYSTIEGRPTYQDSLTGLATNGERALPDVAFDGGTPVSIYDTDNASPGWDSVIGTSFSAPAWAALITVADQGRAVKGLPALSSSDTLRDLYGMPSTNFNDIANGSNGAYNAGMGYDLVTGLGTPKVASVVSSLVAGVNEAQFISETIAPVNSSTVTNITSSTHTMNWIAGDTYTENITYQNTGTTTWVNTGTPDSYFFYESPADTNLMDQVATLMPTAGVAPGQTVTFTFNVAASITPGTYVQQWQLQLSNVQYFGDLTPATSINVVNPASLSNGVLTVLGSNTNDAIFLATFNGTLTTTVNSVIQHFSSAGISSVVVTSGSGNDTVSISNNSVTGGVSIQNTGSVALSIIGGSMTFGADAGSAAANLTIEASSGAAVIFSATQHLAGLLLDTGTSATLTASTLSNVSNTLAVGNLSIAGGITPAARLNLNNNGMIITGSSSNLSLLQAELAAGLNQAGGTTNLWAGSEGIVSTSAHTNNNPSYKYSLGFEQANASMSYAGQSIAAGNLFVRYTYAGDANLDGKVDLNDLNIVLNHLGSNTTLWANGNLDYAPTVDLSSLNDVLNGLGQAGGAGPSVGLPLTFNIAGTGGVILGQLYTLNLASTDTDTIGSWTINWGDGTLGSPDIQVVTGDPSSVQHTYSAIGSYTVSATATDSNGTYSAPNAIAQVFASDVIYSSISGTIGVSTSADGFTLFIADGTQVTSILLAGMHSLTINGGSANQSIIVDQSTGNITLAGSVNVEGTGNITLDISSGAMTFAADMGANAANLTIEASAGAALTFTASQHLAALLLDAGTSAAMATAGKTFTLKNLVVNGVLNFSNGTLNANASAIGGTGVLNVSGGTARPSGLDDAGAINFSGGIFNPTGVGQTIESTGSFTQTGGTSVFFQMDNFGQITLSAGTLIDNGPTTTVESTGSFTQTGGTADLQNLINLGNISISGGNFNVNESCFTNVYTGIDDAGVINLSNGNLTDSSTFTIEGTGAFNQTGGTSYVDNLYGDTGFDNYGLILLSDGTLIDATSNTIIEEGGTFDKAGGSSYFLSIDGDGTITLEEGVYVVNDGGNQ
jgi:Ig-like domain from next to BRCA1 gene/PKD domain